jgi:hypothetical protein
MATRKKSPAAAPMATSQLIAMAERALENGAVIGMVIYMDKEKGLGFSVTEEASPEQVVFMLRQAEHMFLSPSSDYEDDDDD